MIYEQTYKCCNCGTVFYESEAERMLTSYEAEYGVASEFTGHTPLVLIACPECRSDDIEEFEEEEDEDEE